MRLATAPAWPSPVEQRLAVSERTDRGASLLVNGGGPGTARNNTVAQLSLLPVSTIVIPANEARVGDTYQYDLLVRQFNNAANALTRTVTVTQKLNNTTDLAVSTSDAITAGALNERWGVFCTRVHFNAIGVAAVSQVVIEYEAYWTPANLLTAAMAAATTRHTLTRRYENGLSSGINTTAAIAFDILGQLSGAADANSEMQLMAWRLYRNAFPT